MKEEWAKSDEISSPVFFNFVRGERKSKPTILNLIVRRFDLSGVLF
jgi:hypothetical protein